MLLRIPYQYSFLLRDELSRGRRRRTQVFAGSVRAEKGRVSDGRYEKQAMSNPGAYRLIDKETGEKVIVWGGADDGDDNPIPPSHVLSFQNHDQNKGSEDTSHQSVVAGFGRLKAQKVKSLIYKSSQLKKEKPTSNSSAPLNKSSQKVKPIISKSSQLENEKYTSNSIAPLNESSQNEKFTSNLSASLNESSQKEKSSINDKSSQLIKKKLTNNSSVPLNESSQKVNSSINKSSQLKKEKPTRNSGIPLNELSQEAKSLINKSFQLKKEKPTNNTNKFETREIREKMSNSKFIKKEESKDILNNEDNFAKPKNDLFESKLSKNDDSPKRGWGDVSPDDYFDYKSPQRKKFAKGFGFYSKKSFKDIGCADDMIDALKSLSFVRPSHIQAMAFGSVLEGKSCIIADQSGSGKTLAYLAPLIQGLRRDEALNRAKSSPHCPKLIILTPTAELASQVLSNCRSISRSGVPFRSMVATGGFKQKTQLDILKEGIDVLIATPGRFLYLFQEGFVKLSDLKCVVLDEVDILYGQEGFEEVVQILIDTAALSVQYLFVTATLPLDIYNKVVGVFPDCEAVMGPGMHRTSPGLEEILVDCSGNEDEERTSETAFDNKRNSLLSLVQKEPVPKTIIFCNKIESCRKVENALRRLDRKEAQIRVLPFHSAITQDMCKANMTEFLKDQSAESMFLICTDRASRGIDFANVDHVVLFDFPREPSEYVRRVGRTARGAGGVGKAFVFVVGKQVTLARKIMERNEKGHPLHDVPGAYELTYSPF